MKICLLTSVYALDESDPNGSFLVEINKRLVEHGVDVHVLAPSYEGRGEAVVHGVPVHRFRYFPKRFENLTHFQGAPNRIRNPFYLFVAVFYVLFGLLAAVRLCRRERFDILHVQWPFPHGIWGHVASRVSGAPTVLTFHGAELLLALRYPFVRPFLRHALRHAGAVTCNSAYTRERIERLTDKPVHVIPAGCTVAAAPPDAPRAERQPGAPRELLFAGRLIERKGLDVLLRATAILRERGPVRLTVVGDGDCAAQWRALAAELLPAEAVRFLGIVTSQELVDLYREADVFVLPAIVDSRGDTEGLGIVLIEALASRTPVVASGVGGIPDVVKDGETGLLVPERDPAALAAAVTRLFEDPALCARLADAGLRHARTYFDWGRIIDEYLGVYAGVLPDRPRRSPSTTSTPEGVHA